MYCRKFLFGKNPEDRDYVPVSAAELYSPDKGYGFVTEQNRREQKLLKIPELNAAFDALYWYQDEKISKLQEDDTGVFLNSDELVASLLKKAGETPKGEGRRIPLSFKTKVPCQGNYEVTITIRTKEPMEDVLIFTGRRRLAYRGDIPAGTFTHRMMVNVCDIIPRGYTEVFADQTLDITVLASRPRLSAVCVEETDSPTLYIAGDSTVTDQSADYPYAAGTSYAGWGQMIPAYLSDRVAVSNHAHSGLTTESFRREGHYAIVEQYAKAGDFCLFQFGHNDQKLEALKAQGGYRDNLLRYISECREKGVCPLLVTPIIEKIDLDDRLVNMETTGILRNGKY